jgi:hypothetical protein
MGDWNTVALGRAKTPCLIAAEPAAITLRPPVHEIFTILDTKWLLFPLRRSGAAGA